MNQCYPTIYDAGPTLKQHRVNAMCSPGKLNVIESDILRELDFSGIIISDFAINIKKKVCTYCNCPPL